ncbi:MAG: SOS response-associated peptidase [Myxococcota bacterium]|nr:SOS response-associated peptidase [Myxococcota bacterium]
MCGRMVLTRTAHEIADVFDVPEWSSECEFGPRYNVAPSQNVLAVRLASEGGRELVPLHWGLLPSGSKSRASGYRMINARCETAAEKPSFRQALKARRCIVASDGFYEWKQSELKQSEQAAGAKKKSGTKTPYLFRSPAAAPLALAGLWESWIDRDSGEVVESCAVLTCEANVDMRSVHHRMPVLLSSPDYDAWLGIGPEEPLGLQRLMKPAPPGQLEAIEVSSWVNNPRNEDRRCIEPASSATRLA